MPREMMNLIDSIKPILKKLNKVIIRNIYDYIRSESNIPNKLEFQGVHIEEDDRKRWQDIYSQIYKYLSLNPKSKNFLIIKLNTALVSMIGDNHELIDKKHKSPLTIHKSQDKHKDKSSSEHTSSAPPKKRFQDESKKLKRNLVLERAITEACNKVKVPALGNNEAFHRCRLDAKGEPTKELAAVILIYPPENLHEQQKYDYGKSIFEYIKNSLKLTKRSTKNILVKPLNKNEIEIFNKNENRYKTNEHVIAEITIPLAAPAGTVAIRGQTQIAVKDYFTAEKQLQTPNESVNKKSKEVAGFLASIGTSANIPNPEDKDNSHSESSGMTSRSSNDSSKEDSSSKSAEHESLSASTHTESRSNKPEPPNTGTSIVPLKLAEMKMHGRPLTYTEETIHVRSQMRQPQTALPSSNKVAPAPTPLPKSNPPPPKKSATNRLRAQDFFHDDIPDPVNQSSVTSATPNTEHMPTSAPLQAVAKQANADVSYPATELELASHEPRQQNQPLGKTIIGHQLPVPSALHGLQQSNTVLSAINNSESVQSMPSTVVPTTAATPATQSGAVPSEAKEALKPVATPLPPADKNTPEDNKRKRDEDVPRSEVVENQPDQALKSEPKPSSAAVILSTLQGTQKDPITLSDDEREFNERAAKLLRLSALKKENDEKLAKALTDKQAAQDEYKRLRDKRKAEQQAQLEQLERELQIVEEQIKKTETEAKRYKSSRESMGS